MRGEAPGTILQMMHISSRLKKNNWKTFLEIGSGKGVFSRLLLKNGLKGQGIDLNHRAVERAANLNKDFIDKGQYSVAQGDFLELPEEEKFDVIFSCMVIEHIPAEILKAFVEKCKRLLSDQGRIIFLVPSSKKHWGIEDEIAGHLLRYEKEDVEALVERHQLTLTHLSGLTYPLSNWLFSLSNYIVRKNESKMLNASQEERTVYTGSREVAFKTDFPVYMRVALNEFTMYPFYLMQKLFVGKREAMVLYFEMKK